MRSASRQHHRFDMPISSPAWSSPRRGRTNAFASASPWQILSTLDPVHVFQDFATVDLLSGGRAEVIAGRGALHR